MTVHVTCSAVQAASTTAPANNQVGGGGGGWVGNKTTPKTCMLSVTIFKMSISHSSHSSGSTQHDYIQVVRHMTYGPDMFGTYLFRVETHLPVTRVAFEQADIVSQHTDPF